MSDSLGFLDGVGCFGNDKVFWRNGADSWVICDDFFGFKPDFFFLFFKEVEDVLDRLFVDLFRPIEIPLSGNEKLNIVLIGPHKLLDLPS